MASKTCIFFEEGTNAQFEFVLSKYEEAIHAKAHNKSSKPESLLKLDKWYQNELPKKIKSRKDGRFLTHDEIVQTIKWKLARGQFRPRLKDLVQMNTPRVVMQETKKAFRALERKRDLEDAAKALCNLKGVGPAMASAVLAAGAPEVAPFMADEVLLAMPDIEGIDYTMKEYMKLVEKTRECVERLNSQGGNWTPHKVELAVWTHYVARDLKPELLNDLPGTASSPARVKQANGGGEEGVNGVEEAAAKVNGEEAGCGEDSRDSGVVEQDESSEKPVAAVPAEANETPPAAEATAVADSSAAAAPATESVEKGEEKKVVEETKTTEVEEEEAATAEDKPKDNGVPESGEKSKLPENGVEAAAQDNGVEAAAKEEEAAGQEEEEDKKAAAAVNGVTPNGVDCTENGLKEDFSAKEADQPQSNGDSTKEETVKTSCDTPKRALDEEENAAVQADSKRLKTADELAAAPPIPAGGD